MLFYAQYFIGNHKNKRIVELKLLTEIFRLSFTFISTSGFHIRFLLPVVTSGRRSLDQYPSNSFRDSCCSRDWSSTTHLSDLL